MTNTLYDVELRERMTACWIGKTIGGTLGAPFEAVRDALTVTGYDPMPTAAVPNDDLDLQVVWAVGLLRRFNGRVTSKNLARLWLDHVGFPWNEYGVALRNLADGYEPPVSGALDNWYARGEGAAIRTEIWACLAPGDPELAARLAAEDAVVDHSGEGVEAPRFLAAAQSLAFVIPDLRVCLEAGLEQVQRSSQIASVVNFVCERHGSAEPREIRDQIVARYGTDDFTDVVMNTGFVVLGLLEGERNFGRGILTTTNCGMDTDSTTASVGATLGILGVPIPQEWSGPIGRDIVLSPEIYGLADPPRTISQFVDMLEELRGKVVPPERPATTAPYVHAAQIPAEIGVLTYRASSTYIDTGHLPGEDQPDPLADSILRHTLLEGTSFRIEKAADGEVIALRFTIEIDKAGEYRIMVNTAAESRVWVDGSWAFGREGGRMAPSPHQAPLNQFADLELAAGRHTISVLLRLAQNETTTGVVIGVADAITKHWMSRRVFVGPKHNEEK